MKALPTNHKKEARVDRDIAIGRALSCVLAGSTPGEQCPTTEQMASYLDGACTHDERDLFLAHLANCARCREIYILAHDLNKTETVSRDHRRWYASGGALAAAALIVLAVKLAIQEPVMPGQQVAQTTNPLPRQALAPTVDGIKPQGTVAHSPSQPPRPVTFTCSLAARQLAKAASTDALAAAIGTRASGSYGFAGSSRNTTAFITGKELFELELWLAAGDKERAGLAGERLTPLLRSMGADTAAITLDNVLRSLETDSASVKYENITIQLETLLKTGDQDIVHLGSWAAAAKLASGVGKDPYFAGNPPRRFLKELGGSISPAAQSVLKKLDKKQKGNSPEQIGLLLDELANAI